MKTVAVIVALVAQILAGESGPNCGDAGRMMVARSIVTRRVWWRETWEDIAREYHARGTPTAEDLEVARRVVDGVVKPNGYPFVLSDSDVAYLRLGEPDARVECAGGGHLNAYRRWRETRQHWVPHKSVWAGGADSPPACVIWLWVLKPPVWRWFEWHEVGR